MHARSGEGSTAGPRAQVTTSTGWNNPLADSVHVVPFVPWSPHRAPVIRFRTFCHFCQLLTVSPFINHFFRTSDPKHPEEGLRREASVKRQVPSPLSQCSPFRLVLSTRIFFPVFLSNSIPRSFDLAIVTDSIPGVYFCLASSSLLSFWLVFFRHLKRLLTTNREMDLLWRIELIKTFYFDPFSLIRNMF